MGVPKHIADDVRTDPMLYGVRIVQFLTGVAAMGYGASDVASWRDDGCAPPSAVILTTIIGTLTTVYTLYLLPITVPKTTFGWRFYELCTFVFLDICLFVLWIVVCITPLPPCDDMCAGCPAMDYYGDCVCPADDDNGRPSNGTSVTAAAATKVLLARKKTKPGIKKGVKPLRKTAGFLYVRFGLAGPLSFFFFGGIVWSMRALIRARKGEKTNADGEENEAAGRATEHNAHPLSPVPEVGEARETWPPESNPLITVRVA